MTRTKQRRIAFNGVDSLMRGLDEPSRPQTIELEVAVSERLDAHRVRDAVVAAADRHPMARARQVESKPFDLDYGWTIEDAFQADPVEVHASAGSNDTDSIRDTFFSRHISLDAAPPFRLALVHEPAGDRVMLSVNHVAFDGVGTFRLLQSISRAYAGQDDPLPDVDPLEVRRMLDAGNGRGAGRGVGAKRPSLDLGQRPARLAARRPTGSGGPGGFGILHLDLDVADAAPPDGATVNDVLVAALHLTVEQWNRANGTSTGHVAIMMPANQRPRSWRGEVLANLVLAARVVSTPADRLRPDQLLDAVAAQTKAIKVNGVGATAAMARTSQTPVVLRRLLPRVMDAVADWTADTAVLSNLGRVDDPPRFASQVRGLWFSPPPREPVILTMGAATVADRLGVSIRWCRSAVSAEAAADFEFAFRSSLAAVRSAG